MDEGTRGQQNIRWIGSLGLGILRQPVYLHLAFDAFVGDFDVADRASEKCVSKPKTQGDTVRPGGLHFVFLLVAPKNGPCNALRNFHYG